MDPRRKAEPAHVADEERNVAPPVETPAAEPVEAHADVPDHVPAPRPSVRHRVVEDDLIGRTHATRVYEDGVLVSDRTRGFGEP